MGVDVNPGLTDSKYRLSPLPGQLWQGILGFPGSSDGKKAAQTVRNLPAVQETWVQPLGQEDPLEKEMATHSSILAWKIPWPEEPVGLQSMGSQRVRHDWTTLHFHMA